MEKKKIDRIIEAFRKHRSLIEDGGGGMGTAAIGIANRTNVPGDSIKIAGLPPDTPPVFRGRKNSTVMGFIKRHKKK